jgi:hypothetical protein
LIAADGTRLGGHGHAVGATRPFQGTRTRKPSEISVVHHSKQILHCPECDEEMTLFDTDLAHCDACGSEWYVRKYGGRNATTHVFVDITKFPA